MRLLVFVLFVFSSTFSFAQKKEPFKLYPQISVIEMRILDTISRIYEVKVKRSYILNSSKGNHMLKPIIYKRPEKGKDYYWIKVLEETGGEPIVHYNFYVKEKTLEIKYFDPVTKKDLTLSQWRRKKR